MKILIAPDSFKGCLRSHDAANAIKAGLAEVLPNAEIITFPMADGGEGTAEALTASAGGYFVELDVEGPLGDNVRAGYGMIGGDCAVMDMAVASGIELLPVSRLNPMKASSFGTGQMILDASRRE